MAQQTDPAALRFPGAANSSRSRRGPTPPPARGRGHDTARPTGRVLVTTDAAAGFDDRLELAVRLVDPVDPRRCGEGARRPRAPPPAATDLAIVRRRRHQNR